MIKNTINKNKIDITNLIEDRNFTLSNYLNERQVFEFIILGVPCGAIQSFYNNKELTYIEEYRLSDKQLEKVRLIYIPINSVEELKEYESKHFCSYTINPKYITIQEMESFIYRFDLLTKVEMGMFNIDEINKHQTELLNDIPLTYKKLEVMKNKYITVEKEREYIDNNKKEGITEKRFYKLLNGKKYNKIQRNFESEL